MPEFTGHAWKNKNHVELQIGGQPRAQIFTDGAKIYVRCAWPFAGWSETFEWSSGCTYYQLGVRTQYEGTFYGPNYPNPRIPADASNLRAIAIEIFGYDPGELVEE